MPNESDGRLRKILSTIFLVTGTFFGMAVVIGESTFLLVGPAAVSLLAFALLVVSPRARFVRSVVVSAGLYNLIIMIYQTYYAVLLLRLGFTFFATAAAIGYGVGAIVFALAVLAAYFRASALGPVTPQASEDSRKSTHR